MTPQGPASRSTFERFLRGIPPVRALIDNAFRIEDAWRLVRVRRARALGHLTVVEPYTGYGSTSWVRVLGRVYVAPQSKPRRRLRLPHWPRPRREQRVRGWRSFVRVSVGNIPVKVTVDGGTHIVRADRGGVIDVNLPARLSPGWHTIRFESYDKRVSEAPVFVIGDDQRVGLISDIDDTIMVTALPRPMLAAWNTFVLDVHARTPTPGMSVLYERMLSEFGRETTPVVYLSTGPWNVAPTLARFLGRNLYPAGPLLLTDWGPTPHRIFRSGREHKESNLERLAQEFPHIQWLLVGDDGQHDQEIYGDFVRRHPDCARGVAIRQLSTSEAVLAGGLALTAARWQQQTPVPWVTAPDGAGLAKGLLDAGVLRDALPAPSLELDDEA